MKRHTACIFARLPSSYQAKFLTPKLFLNCLIQSITAGVIFPAADATAQLFDKNKGDTDGGGSWDVARTLRWLFFGFAVQAPWNHVRIIQDRRAEKTLWAAGSHKSAATYTLV